MRKDTPWHWSPEHGDTLQVITDLSSDTVMSYFDPAKETESIDSRDKRGNTQRPDPAESGSKGVPH